MKTQHTDRAGNSSGGFCRLSQFDVFPTPLKIQYQMIRIGYVCTWGQCALLYVSRKRGQTEVPHTRIDPIAYTRHSLTVPWCRILRTMPTPTTTSTTLTSPITRTTAQCNVIHLSLYVVEWGVAISTALIKKDACPKCKTTYSDRAAPLFFFLKTPSSRNLDHRNNNNDNNNNNNNNNNNTNNNHNINDININNNNNSSTM